MKKKAVEPMVRVVTVDWDIYEFPGAYIANQIDDALVLTDGNHDLGGVPLNQVRFWRRVR